MRIAPFALLGLVVAGCNNDVVTPTDKEQENRAPEIDTAQLTTPEDTPLTVTVVTRDADNDVLSLSVTQPSHGAVTQSGATFIYTPVANYNGSDSFRVTVSDGEDSAEAAISITVSAVNDDPVAADDTAATPEDTPSIITAETLLGNDTDVDGDALRITAVSNAQNGTVSLPANRVIFTPAPEFAGTATFTYTISDGRSTDTATVTVTVSGENDAPFALNDSATTNEDTAVTLTAASLLANDNDADGQTLTVTAVSNATNGTVVLNGTDITFTPAANFSGAATFDYTVSDGTLTDTGVVTVTVTAVNDLPVANGGAVMTDEDTPITVTLTGSDVEGSALTFTVIASATQNGTLGALTQLTPTSASITYTPNANSTVDDVISFRVNDGTADSPLAMVMIDVVPVADPPVANAGTATTDEDTPVTITLTGTDPEGNALTFSIVATPTSGTLGTVTQATPTSATVTYTPNPNANGTDAFTFRVNDGASFSAPVSVNVTVNAVNDGPVAVDDVATTDEDQALSLTAATLLSNDTDVDNATLTITAVSNATNGTVTLVGTNITFTPSANFFGTAGFDYTVSDGNANDTAHVTLAVAPVNDVPVAGNDRVTVDEDAPPVTVNVLANDSDVEGAVTIITFTTGANGTVALDNGVITYAPNANYNGPDSFTYTIEDSDGDDATATVNVTVTPVNDAPVANDGVAIGNENSPITITLTASDVDGNPLTFAITTPPTRGTLGAITQASATSATVTYTSNLNTYGDDTFGFTASDGTATSAEAEILVSVANVIVCPDGVIEGSESCDDNNAAASDGCSTTCQTETGWNCTGQPSTCAPVCNDGVQIAGREECDDGDLDDTDGCTTRCKVGPVCNSFNASLVDGDTFETDPDTGTCYVSFDDDQTTWANAQNACVAAGGHLATITNVQEQSVVSAVQNTAQNPWIGLADELVEGSFGWVTGEPLTYTNWNPGQPDGADPEDCVNLFSSALATGGNAGTWNDTSCNFIGFTEGRICELAANTCGDGFLQTSRGEQCDDKNGALFDGCTPQCRTETIFFSEYVEGTGTIKAVEIANPFTTAASLNNCSLRLHSNGNAGVSASVGLAGLTIAPNDVLVVCNNSAVSPQCDLINSAVVNFNGDDAVTLFCNGVVVDTIGQVGTDPGTEWGTGLASTVDNTIRRKCTVTVGDAVANDAFDPSIEWAGFATDTVSHLGVYMPCP